MHTDFIDRYIAVWHEPDAARVGRAHDEFVGAGGYVFRARGPAEVHHDGVRFLWEMVPAAGGAVAGAGSCSGAGASRAT